MLKPAMRILFPLLALLTTVSVIVVAYGNGPVEKSVSPTAAHFPQNKQNESPMAVNPVDPNNVITGANDEINEPDCTPPSGGSSSCPFVLGVDLTGVYWTTDGGSTWNQTVLDWCPNDDPSDPNCLVIADGDPVKIDSKQDNRK